MPKAKPPRESAFDEEPPRIPHISAKAVNEIYEKGFDGLPTTAFEDPVEKENEYLKEQVAHLQAQLEAHSSAVTASNSTLMVHDFQLTPTGLIAPEQVSYEAWAQLGHLIFRLEGSIQWLIGDWLAYGVELRYGEMPKIAEQFGRDEKTLHNYKQICQKVESTRRRVDLSFGHHEAVQGLSPSQQISALAYAAEKGLSVADFRKWLRGSKPALADRQPTITEQDWTEVQHFFTDPHIVMSLSKDERREAIKSVEKVLRWWKSMDSE